MGARSVASGRLGGDLGGDPSVRTGGGPGLAAHPLRAAAAAAEQRQPAVRLAGAGRPRAHLLARLDGEGAHRASLPPGSVASPLVGDDAAEVRLTALVRGRVQGVGFRWWVGSVARQLGLRGWAVNLDDGRVEIVAEGSRESCERLLDVLRSASGPGRVTGVAERWASAMGGVSGFHER